MTAVIHRKALLGSALVAFMYQAPPVRAQSSGADIGLAIGLGLLGGVLNQQRTFPNQPQPRDRHYAPNVVPAPDADLMQVQRALNARGFDAGPPNGRISERTTMAISDFQRANGFLTTGRITRAQITVLMALPLGSSTPVPTTQSDRNRPNYPSNYDLEKIDKAPSLKTVQEALNVRGFNAGPPTGKISERTTIAIADFQRANGFEPTGRITKVQIAVLLNSLNQSVVKADDAMPATDKTMAPNQDFQVPQSQTRKSGIRIVLPAPQPLKGIASTESLDAPPVKTVVVKNNGLFGDWEGDLTCGDTNKKNITIKFSTVQEVARISGNEYQNMNLLAADRAGRIAGIVNQFVPQNHRQGTLSTRIVGEFDEESGGYRFVSVDRSAGIGELKLDNIIIKITDNNLVGELGEARCKISGKRPDLTAGYDQPSVPLPLNGGSFYRAADLGARCDILIKWALPAQNELTLPDYRAKPVDASAMFIDNEFVPIFGITFDNPRASNIASDVYKTVRDCQRDPLTNPKLTFIKTNVMNVVFENDGFDQSTYLSITQKIRVARATIKKINSALLEARKSKNYNRNIVNLATASTEFEKSDLAILKERRENIKDSINATLSQYAELLLSAEIDDAQKADTSIARLEKLKPIRDLDGPVARHLNADAKERVRSKIFEIESVSASEVFDPMIATAQSSEASLEGVSNIDSLNYKKLLALLSKSLSNDLEKRWIEVRTDKERKALKSELNSALELPRNVVGLEHCADWFRDFKRRWISHENSALYKQTVDEFSADRKLRLQENLAAFTSEINLTSSELRSKVRDRYLPLLDDENNPISLEYDLVIAGL